MFVFFSPSTQVLLGTFTCTSVPGEFVWLPGILTEV